jgi:hypothetical protein
MHQYNLEKIVNFGKEMGYAFPPAKFWNLKGLIQLQGKTIVDIDGFD